MTSGTYGLRLLGKPRVQITVLALIAGIVLVFRAIQLLQFVNQAQFGYDFSYYWTAARQLLDDLPIYSAVQLAGPYAPQGQPGFLYPPPLAAVVTPLAAFFPSAPKPAAWVWLGLGVAILVASVLVLWRTERLGERHRLLAGNGRWLVLAAAFAFPPVIGELALGNAHLLLLGLLTIAWLGVREGGRRGEWVAGAAVGVAATVKVFPALLLLWFLLTRRFHAAAAVIAGAALFALLTLPITGVEPWTQFPTVLANLSAPADPTDTLAPTVWLTPSIGFTPARVLVTLAGVALLAYAAASVRPGRRVEVEGSGRGEIDPNLTRSFATAVIVSVLISPAVYHHYLALFVLPFCLALGAGVPVRWLALAYLLMWGGQQNALGDWAWVINRAMPTLGALVLLAALCWPARPLASPVAGPSPAPVG